MTGAWFINFNKTVDQIRQDPIKIWLISSLLVQKSEKYPEPKKSYDNFNFSHRIY